MTKKLERHQVTSLLARLPTRLRKRLLVSAVSTAMLVTALALAVASQSVPASASAWPICQASQLSGTRGQTSAGMGHVQISYTLTNVSQAACSLSGYPGFQLYASDGTPLATSVQWAPAPKAPVQLRPGAKAYFVLQYATQTGYGNLSCPTSAALEVTPPNDYGHLVLTGAAGRLQPYGGTFENLECGQIHVKPVTATPGD